MKYSKEIIGEQKVPIHYYATIYGAILTRIREARALLKYTHPIASDIYIAELTQLRHLKGSI